MEETIQKQINVKKKKKNSEIRTPTQYDVICVNWYSAWKAVGLYV